jgi:ribosome biogenesis protein NSA2
MHQSRSNVMEDVLTIMNESKLSCVSSNNRRKKEAREAHRSSKVAQSLIGLKAKLHNRKRHVEKIQMKKQIKQHEQRNIKQSEPSAPPDGAVPTYLLDRAQEKNAKQLSSMVKQKRKEAAARFSVPLPKVRGMAEEEVFKVLKTGKSKGKSWKRVITKPTFVGEGFTRRPVKV